MTISKNQLIAIGIALLTLILLLSLRTKPKDLLSLEKERSLNLQATDPVILRNEAVDMISGATVTRVQILEAQIAEASDDTKRTELLKELSSVWYNEGQFGLAGSYAEEVAKIEDTDRAWAIAGTSFAQGIKKGNSDKEKQFCLSKALQCLEKAASLAPDIVSHQLNRGILLAENPPQDNPMKGVLLLLDLNKKYPENVPVINNIAKFALQTGQLDRAEERLLTALDLEPDNVSTSCLLAQLYSAKGDKDKSAEFAAKCQN